MPYGKLVAKAWGHESGIPVLALTGHNSDCSLFDKLIPLLNNQFYIVAVDSPGQGQSSHRPHGCLYTEMHDLLDYRRAIDFLGWKKFHILGYCYGGGIGCLFSSIFPHLVEKIVVFDKIKPISNTLSEFPNKVTACFNKYLDLEKELLKPPKVFTYEEEIFKFRRIADAVSLEGLHLLLKRSTHSFNCGNTFMYTRDVRAQLVPYISLRSHRLLYRYLSGVKSELLMIVSSSGDPFFKTDDNDVEKFYDIYKKNSKNFLQEYVEGNHACLLDHPERLAPLINRFLDD